MVLQNIPKLIDHIQAGSYNGMNYRDHVIAYHIQALSTGMDSRSHVEWEILRIFPPPMWPASRMGTDHLRHREREYGLGRSYSQFTDIDIPSVASRKASNASYGPF